MAETKNPQNLFQNLPDHMSGWTKNPDYKIFLPENLFEYIDGGAELYLSYGFKKCLSVTYHRQGHPDITADIFDMGLSTRAFGVFSHSRESQDHSIGQGSEYSEGLLIFWKGRYFVSIMAYPETGEVKEVIVRLANRISDWVQETGHPPVIITQLPSRGLIPESIRYFYHHIWLNSHYFISNDNILHIDQNSQAVLAKYRENGKKYLLLLVEYDNHKLAEHARNSFVEHFLSGSPEAITPTDDNSWAGCRLDRTRLWVVLNAGEKKDVIDIFSGLGFK